MKKLALALVCLFSVAFFASCDQPVIENPQPTIAIMATEGYVHEGMDLLLNESYPIGFICTANAQTNKQLARLVINVNDEVWCDTTITGMEFTFDSNIKFVPQPAEKGESVPAVITAVLTDEAGETATAEINITVTEPDVELTPTSFRWYRLGNTITGLDEYGLIWKGNYPKDTYAKIQPAEGVSLFIFSSKDWQETLTLDAKSKLFHNAIENNAAVEEYFNVNVTQGTMTYDDVIGTIMPDGTMHLIHITNSTAQSQGSAGTEINITGEAK